ncbi:MAG: hypothetical protein IT210_23180 [Armatimonadetes bacterium]|nr:hypothetical protein [Armatimonadota bacterium]
MALSIGGQAGQPQGQEPPVIEGHVAAASQETISPASRAWRSWAVSVRNR